MEEPVGILWLWADGPTRFVKRFMPKKGYCTAFSENQTMALIAEERQQCIFTGTIEADDDGKRLDMSDLFVCSIKKSAVIPLRDHPRNCQSNSRTWAMKLNHACRHHPLATWLVTNEYH